jgi:hypothetical protein
MGNGQYTAEDVAQMEADIAETHRGDYTIEDYTIEGYDIRLEVREDSFVNFSISYTDKFGVAQEAADECVTLDYALQEIAASIREHRAGAF